MLQPQQTDYKRVTLAVFLAAILLIGWQIKVEWPRRQALAQLHAETTTKREVEKNKHVEKTAAKDLGEAEENIVLTHEQRIAASPRVRILSDKLRGSISLKGARFDDLSLIKYREHLTTGSPEVTLLSPSGDAKSYFAHIGWLAQDGTKVPDQNTLWQSDTKEMTSDGTVNLRWSNGEGITFLLAISLDKDYMFTIDQKIENTSGRSVSVIPYGFVNRVYEMPKHAPFLHEGAIGTAEGTLHESNYKTLQEKGTVVFEKASGWLGISDHYWLAALIPSTKDYKLTYSHYNKNKQDRYQVDYMGAVETVDAGKSVSQTVRLFAGAKELDVLDHYADGSANKAPIPLFDRALDYGVFYFLAKPMCLVVHYLFMMTGNFGVAILLFIIVVKALMFPLANKSYKSMAQMRVLQPEMLKLRERYVDDQIGMHKAMRDLYKREKVNPASGCLPVLIQILVFIALFRGLNVTIEMRHAPFYGWIKDLSAPDPSNLFTLFGLLDWNAPSFLHLGLLPIVYCITMIIQTKQQPTPPDPIQAKMMTYMPYFMLIFFDTMASGFVLYWTWSNIISIIQQHYISKRYNEKKVVHAS
jgi:YidC/Oxa1 family membrane protein insertase